MREFIDKGELLDDILNTTIHITGMRSGKTILIDITTKIREALINKVKDAPTADVEYVRHGKWITVGKSKSGNPIRMCSYCETKRKGVNKSAYCRDCGAKMDLSEEAMDGQLTFNEIDI